MQRGNGKMVRSTLTGMPEDHYGRMEKSRLHGYFEKKKQITLFYIYLILYDIHLKWKHYATSYTFYKSYRQPK